MSLRPVFLRALVDPAVLASQPAARWQPLLAMGRRHGISGRWFAQLEGLELLDDVPARVRTHLWADHCVAANHARRVRREIVRLNRALKPLGTPWALLRGAAYIAADLPPGNGRLVGDIEVLVPRDALPAVKNLCSLQGSQMPPQTAGIEHCDRGWRDELPPLHHALRAGMIEVHPTLLPLTDPLHPEGEELLARRVAAGNDATLLAPADLVLHSAFQGFQSGEFQHCLRDLTDVHELVLHFATTLGEEFWSALLTRALTLRGARPLLLALGQAEAHLGLRVPAALTRELRQADRRFPPTALVSALIERMLVPDLPPSRVTRIAGHLLWARAQWLKMPLRLRLPQ